MATASCDGPTDIDNLILLCDQYHNGIHKPGWTAKLLPHAVFELTDPAGTVQRSHPPGDPDTRPRFPI